MCRTPAVCGSECRVSDGCGDALAVLPSVLLYLSPLCAVAFFLFFRGTHAIRLFAVGLAVALTLLLLLPPLLDWLGGR